MKRILAALALLGLAFVATADAQLVPFPQSMPAKTVVGRTGISAGPAQAIPFSVLNSILVTPALNVMNFGCAGNGVADDTACIQSAINALSPSGGFVDLPVGTYKVTSSINLGNGNSTPTASTRNGIVLRGIGNPTGTAVAGFPTTTGAKLLWAGGATPVIMTQGPLAGWGVQNLNVDCQSVAGAVGIQETAAVFGDNRDLQIVNCSRGISTNSYPNAGNLHNSWRNVHITVPTLASSFGILVTGDGVGTTSNTSFDHFENIDIALPGTLTTFGVYLQAADSNYFYNVHISGGNVLSTAIGFDYNAVGVGGGWPASNMFFGLEPFVLGGGAQFANGGTPGAGATANVIIGLAESNSAACPNIPNLACKSGRALTFSSGGNTNNTAIVPPSAPGATVNFQIPNVSGTPAVSVPSPLSLNASTGAATWSGMSSDGILAASSATAVVTNRCSMDANQSIACSSASNSLPQQFVRNSTADSSAGSFTFGKSRSGGNTNSGDSIGAFNFQGFANAGFQQSASIAVSQSAASSGSNVPTKIVVQTSNTAGQLNQSWTFNEKGHMAVTASAAPTLTAGCNGAGSSVTGNNVHGTVTGSTAAATTCTLTFANSGFTATPDCNVTGLTSPLTGAITPTTTTLVVNFASTANYKFTWHCFGL